MGPPHTLFVTPIIPLRPQRPRRPRRAITTTSPRHRRLSQVPPQCRPRRILPTGSAVLRDRIAGIQSAEKIVTALRIVAAARIRASSDAALRARPFAELLARQLAQLMAHIRRRDIDVMAIAQACPPLALVDMHGPFLADPVVQKALMDRLYLAVLTSPTVHSHAARKPIMPVALLAVITADRKFCGGYNKDVISRAVIRLRDLRQRGFRIELVLVGAVAHRFFARNFADISVCLHAAMPHGGLDDLATTVSHALLTQFIGGSVRRVEVIYTRFVSLLSTAPSVRTLLPLTPSGLESVGDELFQLALTTRQGRIIPTRVPVSAQSPASTARPHAHLYDMSDEDAVLLLNSMLPMYVTSQVLRMLREALASEQVSRLGAMTAASENARELIANLRTQYHRERQARITTEIIEVVSNTNS